MFYLIFFSFFFFAPIPSATHGSSGHILSPFIIVVVFALVKIYLSVHNTLKIVNLKIIFSDYV